MRNAMAFDLGTKLGCAWSSEDQVHTEMVDLTKGEKDAIRAQKFARFAQYVKYRLETDKPDFVVYERPFSRGLAATRHGWGFAGILEASCCFLDIPCVDQVPTTIKKWATGSGKASKEDMIAKAHEALGKDVSEHEADAYLLLMYAMEKTGL
mgnify:CR=1 FL=1